MYGVPYGTGTVDSNAVELGLVLELEMGLRHTL